MVASQTAEKAEKLKWTFHPRVFMSLGAELVTNDLVAVVELVKNSYDAFATRVDIRFVGDGGDSQRYLEIADNGFGMDRETIVESWTMVGTPFKAESKSVAKSGKTRRVTGEKGLGRLAAARLGKRLTMFTKQSGGPCYRVDVDWEFLQEADDLSECDILLQAVENGPVQGEHGTILRIGKLGGKWDTEGGSDFPDLKTELSRFVPPFTDRVDFDIYLAMPGKGGKPVRIEPEEILYHPKYSLKGETDEKGVFRYVYKYGEKSDSRTEDGSIDLEKERATAGKKREPLSSEGYDKTNCGPFGIEIRVWDMDKESLFELADRLHLPRKVAKLRKTVSESPFAGISLYRDSVLVLPKQIEIDGKQNTSRKDWLGINQRRISRIGNRVDLRQTVGYVEIGADRNPLLKDTADRERLVDNAASRKLQRFVFKIIGHLEDLRTRDRTDPSHKEPPLKNLFDDLKETDLASRLKEIEKNEGGWKEIHEAAKEHTTKLKKAVGEIQQRFYYYSRLAVSEVSPCCSSTK